MVAASRDAMVTLSLPFTTHYYKSNPSTTPQSSQYPSFLKDENFIDGFPP
jgi:hypothetical protein